MTMVGRNNIINGVQTIPSILQSEFVSLRVIMDPLAHTKGSPSKSADTRVFSFPTSESAVGQ